MNKPAWACSKCGMNSSRKSSVLRHIDNLHARDTSLLVTYSDYLAGIKLGLYSPEVDRLIFKKEQDYELIMKEEFCKEMARAFVRRYTDIALDLKKASPDEIAKALIESKALLDTFPWFIKNTADAMRKA